MTPQPFHRLGCHLGHLAAELAAVSPQVVLHEQRQVLAPLAQRRQGDREDSEPVVEVRTELPLGRQDHQVAVGGGDQPDVGLYRLVAPDSLERLFLQQPQYLGLHGQRCVADLVEEQRAAVALLELADAAAVGAGEGALLVAEQLALQQRLGDGGAVQRQERRLRPRPVVVDGAGDELLAGAALAGDQDRDVLRGDAADGLVDLTHRRAAAEDRAIRVGIRLGLGDHRRGAHPTGDLQGLADHPPQMVQVERLEEVVVGALLHRLNGRIGRLLDRHENHGNARVDLADLPVDLQAGLVGQPQVEQDDVGRPRADRFQARRRGACDLHAVCRGGERLTHLLRDEDRIVVDQQEVRHDRAAPVT